MPEIKQVLTIYTIVYTAADTGRGRFHNAEARGRFLSLASAQRKLERRIAAGKATLDSRTLLEI